MRVVAAAPRRWENVCPSGRAAAVAHLEAELRDRERTRDDRDRVRAAEREAEHAPLGQHHEWCRRVAVLLRVHAQLALLAETPGDHEAVSGDDCGVRISSEDVPDARVCPARRG